MEKKTLEELFSAGYEGINTVMKEVDKKASVFPNDVHIVQTQYLLRAIFSSMVKMDAIVEVLVDVRDNKEDRAVMPYTDLANAASILHGIPWPTTLQGTCSEEQKAYDALMSRLVDLNYHLAFTRKEVQSDEFPGLDMSKEPRTRLATEEIANAIRTSGTDLLQSQLQDSRNRIEHLEKCLESSRAVVERQRLEIVKLNAINRFGDILREPYTLTGQPANVIQFTCSTGGKFGDCRSHIDAPYCASCVEYTWNIRYIIRYMMFAKSK